MFIKKQIPPTSAENNQENLNVDTGTSNNY